MGPLWALAPLASWIRARSRSFNCASSCTESSLPLKNSVNAVGTCRAQVKAENAFFQQHCRYATLHDLGPAGDNLIPGSVSSGEDHGYKIEVAVVGHGYMINLTPLIDAKTGYRSLYVDQTGVIRDHWAQGPASADDPPRFTSSKLVLRN